MKYYKLIIAICLPLTILLLLNACRKYLDAKPDKKMVVPASLQDLQALLDDVATMNLSWPIAGEVAADNYYLTSDTWASLPVATDKENYVWSPDVSNDKDWSAAFKVVFKANVVLETLNGITPSVDRIFTWNEIRGSALFYRAFAFFMVAQEFAPVYDPVSASTDVGIPLRLTADINEVSVRASVEQTYSTIIKDLETASQLLPTVAAYKTRPSRLAAFALLSRVHLSMSNYIKAAASADSCINEGAQLLDYNDVAAASEPFIRFHKEVLFHVCSNYSYCLDPSRGNVDSTLVQLYGPGDLRRQLFLRSNPNRSSSFRGNYNGNNASQLFSGLATDEVYLNLAECHARRGNVTAALQVLNTFRQKRYTHEYFQPVSAGSAGEALAIVLEERRKQLLFRMIRWTDLRRLNKDNTTAKTIIRKLNGDMYTLSPHDLRYVLQIPNSVTALVDIPKNPR
ncbi:RagB/SusD family nutrient uptake outer membrane protein [Chitinophaga oryzae]|uniref:RagB/SusD family nutrient uptake outer membrane protein n=1 Tax=Chitinophaga oryzae TaxID=2725414 RepID=A0AAE7D4W2_9BACT|nr:RagB/SusD family nutrient uptake outer membrane protein [Chitinophaga oryzae]QJB29908.1 RagB/SusD family nutrient uptake outer membrane protein [Chitinophaga oryzae]